MPQGFDNIFNKFKASTKQAADQMGKATKVARLKMDILTLTGERSRHLQTVGERTYESYAEAGTLDGGTLCEKVRHEFTQIERIDGRVRDLENQIADLQAMQGDASDVTDATDVKDVTDTPGTADAPSSSDQG